MPCLPIPPEGHAQTRLPSQGELPCLCHGLQGEERSLWQGPVQGPWPAAHTHAALSQGYLEGVQARRDEVAHAEFWVSGLRAVWQSQPDWRQPARLCIACPGRALEGTALRAQGQPSPPTPAHTRSACATRHRSELAPETLTQWWVWTNIRDLERDAGSFSQSACCVPGPGSFSGYLGSLCPQCPHVPCPPRPPCSLCLSLAAGETNPSRAGF